MLHEIPSGLSPSKFHILHIAGFLLVAQVLSCGHSHKYQSLRKLQMNEVVTLPRRSDFSSGWAHKVGANRDTFRQCLLSESWRILTSPRCLPPEGYRWIRQEDEAELKCTCALESWSSQSLKLAGRRFHFFSPTANRRYWIAKRITFTIFWHTPWCVLKCTLIQYNWILTATYFSFSLPQLLSIRRWDRDCTDQREEPSIGTLRLLGICSSPEWCPGFQTTCNNNSRSCCKQNVRSGMSEVNKTIIVKLLINHDN